MTKDNVLQNLTNNVIFRQHEKENLKRLANKITKVPTTIKIPVEYLTDLGDKK